MNTLINYGTPDPDEPSWAYSPGQWSSVTLTDPWLWSPTTFANPVVEQYAQEDPWYIPNFTFDPPGKEPSYEVILPGDLLVGVYA